MPLWNPFVRKVFQPSWQYFRREEFACKHCNENLIADDFVTKLDTLRQRVGFALAITSGYRCPVYNNQVSTTGFTGPHTTGKAADLAVSRKQAYIVLREALAMGFTGIGVDQKGESRFIHLDDLTEPSHAPRPTVWSY